MKPAEVVQRNKFLIGVAVLVLVGIAAVILGFLPARRANAQTRTELGGKAKSLTDYAAKQDLAPKAAIAEAAKLAATYQGALDDLRGQLAKQAQPLDEPLKEPGTSTTTQLDGSTWKLVYGKEVDDLAGSVGKSFLVVSANPIVAQTYGDEIPSAADVALQTRYFLVQKYAIGALAGLNDPPKNYVVPVFNGFTFLPAPERLLSPIHGTDFTPIPFEIHVSTDFGNIPHVLYALLKSPVQFEITSISVTRPEHLDRAIAQGSAFIVRSQMSGPSAPKKPAAATAATPSGAEAPGTNGPGLSNDVIAGMVAAQQREAQANAAAMIEQMKRTMPAWMQPGGTGMAPGATTPGAVTTAATPRRTTAARKMDATEITDAIKAQLPKTLVDLTIKGYVADYKKKAS
jgi:hypothetical protein